MNDYDYQFLKDLTEAFGPSGAENAVRKLIIQKITPHVSALRIDALGNLIAAKGDGGDIVISAHMDEVGFIVTGFQDDGTLRFSQVGGITPANLPAKRVCFPERGIFGVIGAKPIHLNKNQNTDIQYSDLYIDIGASTEMEARALISLGDLAMFSTTTKRLGTKRSAIMGKAIDDRLGCYLLCKLICDTHITNCTFLFSVQEEVGLFGASSFAQSHRFSYGIALDVTTPNDLPGIKGPAVVCRTGEGPVISFADGRVVYDNRLISGVFELLAQSGISCQTKALRAGGNEASSFQKDGAGMKSISISTPCRYIHGPVGVVFEEDINATEAALRLILSHIQSGGFHYDERD